MNAPTHPSELAGHLTRLGLLLDAPPPPPARPAGDAHEPGEAEALWRAGAVAAPDLADALAALHGAPRASFAEIAEAQPRMEGLSRSFLRDAFAYPFELDGRIALAVADPSDRGGLAAVKLALGAEPRLVVVSFEEIDLLFEQAAPDSVGRPDAAEAGAESSDDTVEALKDLARGAPVVRLVDQLMERAIDLGATDIHIETGRDELRIRLRVDGHLRTEQTAPKQIAPAVISRVKILASLDIAERRLPQDGRANVFIGRNEADLRVATMPTMYGETAVLRILLKDSRLLEFERIGLAGRDLQVFKGLLAEPHGIVIVTGPTGSGKTTTLATAMQLLNDPSRKIVTVEDPIEYQIPGVHQTQIKPAIGLDFARALRSFLRHDPDIIMVGEMRDPETASIGAQAALTGHLVLTTLHTNSATDAVIRLADMGVEPYLIAASLRGVLGQRLVRRLCDRCKRPDPREDEGARALAAERGFRIDPTARFHAPQGCAACGHTGYRGRVGVFEAMRVDDDLRRLIRENPDPTGLLASARRSGLTTMLEDGVAKAGRGVTTISEVLRTTG
ncbi:GspE/PulE family protein [Hansschlegelia zhihuaiae]|uniref:Type II/IV secretion system protein n=1 Tax=Hansschlegelia zhihuaiae TaxID=405005 RepID=A0A4Q0MAK3_9HYPH|nr:GspE/PulE family protein [Hansschlegelia zhihuaiae]RXF70291.1 type II/IV secretion system protein [Hansschlegelia zhihuaiae]